MRAELATVAEMGSRALDAYFNQLEQSMKWLVDDLRVDGLSIGAEQTQLELSIFRGEITEKLRRFKSSHPEMINVTAMHANGVIIATLTAAVNNLLISSFADESSFKAFSQEPKRKFDIGQPTFGRIAKQWIVPVRYRISDAEGDVRYILSGTLPIDFLKSFWKDAPIAGAATLGLLRDDGFLLGRSANIVSGDAGEDYQQQTNRALIDYIRQNEAPSNGSVQGFNRKGIETHWTFKRLSSHPLTFYVQIPARRIFATWWPKVQVSFILSAFMLLGVVGVYFISARRQTAYESSLQLELLNSKRTAQERDIAMSSMVQGLCLFDAKQRLILCNRQYAKIYGLSEEQIRPGTTLREILKHRVATGNAPDDNERYIEERIATVAAAKPSETIHRLRDGRYIAVMHQPTADGGWVTTHADITDRKKSEAKVEHMARHDALTGLGNRVTLTEGIEEASARFRQRGETFSLLMLDLDQFKQVNDMMGHAAGDTLLQDVASRLRGCLRETDGLARLGGDEFAIIQAGDANQREASVTLADRIISELARPFRLRDNEIHIGASVGIALAPEHSSSADDLLKMADMALYSAKGSGRNCCRVFSAELTDAMSRRHELERDLRRAVEHDELILHYQPIIDAKTHKMCGAEALIRWQHPTKGMIRPDQFIPLAEDTGLIVPIGQWVLHTACKEAMGWPAEMKVAVNLSAKQFSDKNLADVVMYVLADTGLSPERLEIEITETALIESAPSVLPILRQFKNLGISVALDDFGTGYSSLSQLTIFPFDKIKIDKSFTQKMTQRADCAAIISATMTLAHSLNKQTTAEGVETADQYRLLRLAGVTSLQGYLFKRPGPASELDFDRVYGYLELENVA